MKLSHRYHQFSLKFLLSFAAIVICVEAAVAGSLTIKVRQVQYASATLSDSKPTDKSDHCPPHFRTVHLSGDIDLKKVAKVYTEPEFSIHKRASDEKQRVDNLVTGQIQLNLLGCLFGKHFLPQEGDVTLILELEDGQTSTRTFPYDPDSGFNSFGLNYRALLTGRLEVYWSPFREEVFETENKTLGSLVLSFPSEKLPIAGIQSNSEALLDGFGLELVLLSETSSQ
ncbi:hypothetical protein [Aliiroseovarius sp. 2305UL8-7]|uniref:hypothetical protein n=1 Tax=Aliiroseovarius conchicola TaxID=3121637 RepID=UPI003526C742